MQKGLHYNVGSYVSFTFQTKFSSLETCLLKRFACIYFSLGTILAALVFQLFVTICTYLQSYFPPRCPLYYFPIWPQECINWKCSDIWLVKRPDENVPLLIPVFHPSQKFSMTLRGNVIQGHSCSLTHGWPLVRPSQTSKAYYKERVPKNLRNYFWMFRIGGQGSSRERRNLATLYYNCHWP